MEGNKKIPGEIHQAIGARIRLLRQGRGLNMKVMTADIRDGYGVKLDPSYLSKIESGKLEAPLRTLLAICDYFQVGPGWLLEPSSAGVPEGLEEILLDPEFLGAVREFRKHMGDEAVLRHLKITIQEALKLMDGTAQLKSSG